jgi:hypothetical protein
MTRFPPLPTATALEKSGYLDTILGNNLAARMQGDGPAPAADAAAAPSARAAADAIILSPEARKLLAVFESATLSVRNDAAGAFLAQQFTGDPQLASGHNGNVTMSQFTTPDGHAGSAIGVYQVTQHANAQGQATQTEELLSMDRTDTGALSITLRKDDHTYFGGNIYDHTSLAEISIGADGGVSVHERESDSTFYTPELPSRRVTGGSVDVTLADGPDGTRMTASDDRWSIDRTPTGYRVTEATNTATLTPTAGGTSVTTGSEIALRLLDDAKGSATLDVAASRTLRTGGAAMDAAAMGAAAGSAPATDAASVKGAMARVSITT